MDTLPNELLKVVFEFLPDRHPLLRQVCHLWRDLIPRGRLFESVLLESENLWIWGGCHDTPNLLAQAAKLGRVDFLQSAFQRGSLFNPRHCDRHFHSEKGQVIIFKTKTAESLSTRRLSCMHWKIWKSATRAGHLKVLRWISNTIDSDALPSVTWNWTLKESVCLGHSEIFELFANVVSGLKLFRLGIRHSLAMYLKTCTPSHLPNRVFVGRVLERLEYPLDEYAARYQPESNFMVPLYTDTRFHLLSQLSRWGFVTLVNCWLRVYPIVGNLRAILHGAVHASPEFFDSSWIATIFFNFCPCAQQQDLFSWIFITSMSLPRHLEPLSRTETLISLLRPQNPSLVVCPSFMDQCARNVLNNQRVDLMQWLLLEPHLRPGRWHLGVVPSCPPIESATLTFAFTMLPFDGEFLEAVLAFVYPQCRLPLLIGLKQLLTSDRFDFIQSGEHFPSERFPLTAELVGWLGSHRHAPPFVWNDHDPILFKNVVAYALNRGYCDILPIYREWNPTLFNEVMISLLQKDCSHLSSSRKVKEILNWLHHNGFPVSSNTYGSLATLFRMCGPVVLASFWRNITHMRILRLVLHLRTKLQIPWDEASSSYQKVWKPYAAILSDKLLFRSLEFGGCCVSKEKINDIDEK